MKIQMFMLMICCFAIGAIQENTFGASTPKVTILGETKIQHFNMPDRYRGQEISLCVDVSYVDDSTIILACDNLSRKPDPEGDVRTTIGKDYLWFNPGTSSDLRWLLRGSVDEMVFEPISFNESGTVAYFPHESIDSPSRFIVQWGKDEMSNRAYDLPQGWSAHGICLSQNSDKVWVTARLIPLEALDHIRLKGWHPQPYSSLSYFELNEHDAIPRQVYSFERALTEFYPISRSVWNKEGDKVYTLMDATDYSHEPFVDEDMLAEYNVNSARWTELYRGVPLSTLVGDNLQGWLDGSVPADDSTVVFACSEMIGSSEQRVAGYLELNFQTRHSNWIWKFNQDRPLVSRLSPDRKYLAFRAADTLTILSTENAQVLYQTTVDSSHPLSFDFSSNSDRFCFVKQYSPHNRINIIWGKLSE